VPLFYALEVGVNQKRYFHKKRKEYAHKSANWLEMVYEYIKKWCTLARGLEEGKKKEA
jgi:hypothetical protein